MPYLLYVGRQTEPIRFTDLRRAKQYAQREHKRIDEDMVVCDADIRGRLITLRKGHNRWDYRQAQMWAPRKY